MQLSLRLLLVCLLAAAGPGLSPARAADADADRVALAVEALTRIEGVDLGANETLRQKVYQVLDRTRGTPAFLRLVQHFKLTNQAPGLLELVLAQPTADPGVDALRLILAQGGQEAVRATLQGTNAAAAARLAESLGLTGQKDAVPLLLPLAGDARRDGALRRQAVRALARTQEGAREVIALARGGRLDDDLKYAAASALGAARWPEIRAEAARLVPPPAGANATPLPPIAELVRRNGNAANGAKIYARPSPGCINCHVVRGQGTELGPELSEIGSKLGKDALYEAILDPNAGVSFGFEAWNVVLKNGDEVYGLIASETAEELALKAVGGLVTRLKKGEIASRQQSRLSLMPAGLQQGLTTEELVDLVEYLASLRKP